MSVLFFSSLTVQRPGQNPPPNPADASSRPVKYENLQGLQRVGLVRNGLGQAFDRYGQLDFPAWGLSHLVLQSQMLRPLLLSSSVTHIVRSLRMTGSFIGNPSVDPGWQDGLVRREYTQTGFADIALSMSSM